MTDAPDIVLSMSDVKKHFGPVVALRNMRLQIRPGRVHTILGENGAGKSTLMKILVGVYQPTDGRMELAGQPYSPQSPTEAAQRGLAIVFQELSLCNNLSVAENIMATHEPARFGFINDRKLRQMAAELVADLGLPVNVDAKVGDLSIAQRQLVEIAKGLSHPAKVLILDEPTSSLSDSEADILFSIIERLKARGTAIIYISHRMEEIMRLSDDITVIRDGEYVATRDRNDTTIEELIALMVGRRMDEIYPPALAPGQTRGTTPALEVRKLTRADEFADISFQVMPGEILGFFGLVGSGRSEVMNAIFGMRAATGEIWLGGKPVQFRSPVEAIRAGIGFVTENRKEEGLVLGAALQPNISSASIPAFAGRSGFLNFGAERQAAAAEVQRLAIRTNSLQTLAGTLSGGNQQKVVLAKWLLTRPGVLILDEPTRGVDVGAKFEIYRIIRQLASEGTAIIMVSSELPEVLGLADRVAIMAEGRIKATLSGDELTPEHVMAYATGTSK
ncbi:sugar ABC transporter ATP-binding protein [Paracoccus fistulariae]|uniref:Sugar ABC transporter ATP-binding protein n=1 Tax=Paracoccus fistulariae TaxID=658446 RepID=A0ABY7SGF5_9RHOB|nr:sugar ABC transporter ATP-binding protein [Paracoccus fistulariae]MDB6181793.1 sugar ABC transporter ATP-binding protein [Paracoccus fistulariae]WCR05914.1 sugar ABC transporter ATP-binding protein [Paracoccus fistulariae]